MSTTSTVSTTAFSITVEVSTTVAAPPERVWQIFLDIGEYPEWNPFIRRLEGSLDLGGRVDFDSEMGDDIRTRTKAEIVERSDDRLTWLAHLGMRGMLDSRHSFSIRSTAEGSEFIQHERMSGLLIPISRRTIVTNLPASFAALNEALADRVQTRA